MTSGVLLIYLDVKKAAKLPIVTFTSVFPVNIATRRDLGSDNNFFIFLGTSSLCDLMLKNAVSVPEKKADATSNKKNNAIIGVIIN